MTQILDLKAQLLKKQRPSNSFDVEHEMTVMEKGVSRAEKQAILKTFQNACNTRLELIRTLDSVKNTDVCQTILDVVLDDAFSHEVDTPLFTIAYVSGDENSRVADEDITEEINHDMKELDLHNIIENIIDDTIFYGEYYLRHKIEKGKGILWFADDVVLEDTMAVYEVSKPKFFLEKTGMRIFSRSSDEITQFCMGPRKTRIKADDYFKTGTRRLREYLRIGRSVVFPALDKIKQLQTLELADLADNLKKIVSPILVSIGVPANASPQDLVEISEKYETMLSDSFVNLANEQTLTLQTIMSMLTNVKVVPSFTDGKGAISTLDISSDDKNTLENIEATRNAIANATGIPAYYLSLTGGDGNGSKLETLKVYSRYSRKLLVLQDSFADSIKDIILLHHVTKTGIPLDKEHIKISFKSIVSVESLDSMEYSVAAVQTLNDVFTTLTNIAESSLVNFKINPDALMVLVNKFLNTIDGVDNLLELNLDAPVTEPNVEDAQNQIIPLSGYNPLNPDKEKDSKPVQKAKEPTEPKDSDDETAEKPAEKSTETSTWSVSKGGSK
jgi:hypothetical protein